MKPLLKSITHTLYSIITAFKAYPVSILCASAFAIVTIIRIHLEWDTQVDYNYIFNCLHWSLAFGAIFSLAVVTYSKIKWDTQNSFVLSNLLGFSGTLILLVLVYLFGDYGMDKNAANILYLSDIATARILSGIMISILFFIWTVGRSDDQTDFSKSFFMSHKAFFIAMLYGGVVLAGVTSVAGVFQTLLYEEMSVKVYQYLVTIVGFFTFTLFIGYFPDFRKNTTDERFETVQAQPRFIEILFSYILIPIMLAMTVVLVLWSVRSIVSGITVPFDQLSGIATSYALCGLWLYIMTTHHEFAISKFYHRIYPITALVILVFEAWAIFKQLNNFGLTPTAYVFVILWIGFTASSLLLLVKKEKSFSKIALLASVLIVVSVSPVIGQHILPITSQINKLETTLEHENILVNQILVPASEKPNEITRQFITETIYYLGTTNSDQLPKWLDQNLTDEDTFKSKLGFEPYWVEDKYYGTTNNIGTSIYLPNVPIQIEDYKWVVPMSDFKEIEKNAIIIEDEKGELLLSWTVDSKNQLPTLEIKLNSEVIIKESMQSFIDGIVKKYPPSQSYGIESTLEDMTYKLNTDDISVMLVFKNVEYYVNVQNDIVNYWIQLEGIYLKFKE